MYGTNSRELFAKVVYGHLAGYPGQLSCRYWRGPEEAALVGEGPEPWHFCVLADLRNVEGVYTLLPDALGRYTQTGESLQDDNDLYRKLMWADQVSRRQALACAMWLAYTPVEPFGMSGVDWRKWLLRGNTARMKALPFVLAGLLERQGVNVALEMVVNDLIFELEVRNLNDLFDTESGDRRRMFRSEVLQHAVYRLRMHVEATPRPVEDPEFYRMYHEVYRPRGLRIDQDRLPVCRMNPNAYDEFIGGVRLSDGERSVVEHLVMPLLPMLVNELPWLMGGISELERWEAFNLVLVTLLKRFGFYML